MTGSDLAVRERPRVATSLSNEQLQYIANTEFVPQGLRGNLPAILACVATGRALGIDDMSSLRLIHVVNGRPTFSAELMIQIVRRAGHSITGESKEGRAVAIGTRSDNGDTMTVEWTLEMAQRAGLASRPTWKAYPESMLWARAASQLCRMLFADCFAGATYTPEELEDDEHTPSSSVDSYWERVDAEDSRDDSAGEPQGETTTSSPSEGSGHPAGQPSPADTPPATDAQVKKLNVLVGTLRERGHLTTEQVYTATGRDAADWLDENGELHWSPLRDTLTKAEASELIERLDAYEKKVAA